LPSWDPEKFGEHAKQRLNAARRGALVLGVAAGYVKTRKVDEVADDIRTRRAIENLPVLRGYA
jgi:UDP-N-acetyl-D-mannosaminuronic acid transferase (WecB/TagA/CpsF family)